MRRILTVTTLGRALLAVAAPPVSAGWFDRGVKGSGGMITWAHDLGECHAVRLQCGLDIAIRFDDEQRVEFTMGGNLLEHCGIEERGGVLVVSSKGNTRPDRDARLELLLRALDRIEINGANDIDMFGDPGSSEKSVHGIGDVDRK